jgi:hypothetical protein
VCIIGLFIGLIKPNLVIRWGDQGKRTRKSVLKYYGIGILVFLTLSTIFSGGAEPEEQDIDITASPLYTLQENVAIVDKIPALEVESQIKALGDINSLSLDQSAEVQAVRASYESLSAKQQRYVENISILTGAETKISDLQKAADERAKKEAEAERAAIAQAEANRANANTQANAGVGVAETQGGGGSVYITKTGDKYHASECQYLSRSKIAISLSDARSKGYTPCSRCKP